MLSIAAFFLAILALGHSTPIEISLEERQIWLQNDLDLIQDGTNYRLGNDVSPMFYDITLKPYFVDETGHKAFTFDGAVKIQARAEKAGVTTIVLHADRLTIKTVRVYPKNTPTINLYRATFTYDNLTHFLSLPMAQALTQGTDYNIDIEYSGTMEDDMQGFYRSSYMEDGQKKWLGSTQFEQTHARRMMPCFDEPKFKAKFALKIERPNNFNPTLSNTKIRISQNVPGTQRVLDTFKETPIMSTYLLAFIVSEYTGRQNTAKDIGVYAPINRQNQTEYSFQFTEKVLNDFNNYTAYSYLSVPEIEKLDQAAVPDFAAGAMENWGLLTYRDASILYDAKHSSLRNKQRIATVVSHEIAHQWFGDLVTCEWWDVTWLNEGFARFFEYFGTHWVENTWKLDEQFTVDQIQTVFQSDALESTHPMTSEVNTPVQASAIFDSISYNKGGSVIRMMEHLIGPAAFKSALQDYLQQNAFSVVRPENLWTAMQKQAGVLQIGRVMSPWTTQSGYPYINVTVNGDSVKITQQRFLVKHTQHNDTSLWPIPLTFATKTSDFSNTKSAENHIYYKETTGPFTIKLATAPTSFFIVNNQQTGYYRVNYDTESWLKIKATLKSSKMTDIHVINRAQIIDDLFNLARAGYVDYFFALDIVDYVQSEQEYIPWLAAFNGLSHLTQRLNTVEDSTLIKSYVLKLLTKIYNHLGYAPKTTDTHTDALNRVNVLSWLCRYDHEDCLKQTRAEWAKFVANPDTYDVNPDHRALVYCMGIRDGKASDVELLWRRYDNTTVAHEQLTVLSALGCMKDSALINKHLDTILTEKVRYQDKLMAFNAVLSGNAGNVAFVLHYLQQNFETWSNKFGFNGMQDVASAFSKVADQLKTTTQIDELKVWVESNKQKLGESTTTSIEKAVTETAWQIQWALKHGPQVRTFWTFKKNSAASISLNVVLIVMSIVSCYLVL